MIIRSVPCLIVAAVSPRKARRLPADLPRRPRRGGRTVAAAAAPPQSGDSAEPVTRLGPPKTEEWPDGTWVVRRIPGAAATKMYRCPGCDQEIMPGKPHLVATGLSIEVPPGYEAQIRPRSGLAAKHAITLPNSPATIDPGYRGEIRVILLNLGREPYEIHPGDRIAQMVIARYEAIEWEEGELNESRRGEGGFGSSGR